METRGGGRRPAPGSSPETASPPSLLGSDGPPVALAVWGEDSEVAEQIGNRTDNESKLVKAAGRYLDLVVVEASWTGVAAPAFRLDMARCRCRFPEAAPPSSRLGGGGPTVALMPWGEIPKVVERGQEESSGTHDVFLLVMEVSGAGLAAPAFQLVAAGLAEAVLRYIARRPCHFPKAAAPAPPRPGGGGPTMELVGCGEVSERGQEVSSGTHYVFLLAMEMSGAGVPARAVRLVSGGLAETVLRDLAPPPARPGGCGLPIALVLCGEVSKVGKQLEIDQDESSGGHNIVPVVLDVSGAGVPTRAVRFEAAGLPEAVLQVAERWDYESPEPSQRRAIPNATAGWARTAALCVPEVSGLVSPAGGGSAGGQRHMDLCDTEKRPLFVAPTEDATDAVQDYTVKLDNPRTLAASYHFSLSGVQLWLFCFVVILLFTRVESNLDSAISNTSFCPAPHLQFKKPMSHAGAGISKTSNILFQEMETECTIVELQGSQCRKQSIYEQIAAVIGTILAMISNLGPLIPILRIGQVTPARRSLLRLCSISLSASYLCWMLYVGPDDCKSLFGYFSLLLGCCLHCYYSWFFWQNNCNSMKSLSSVLAGLVSVCLGIGFGLLACSEFMKLGPEILSGANTIAGIAGVCGVLFNITSFGLRVLSGSGRFDKIPFVLTLCGTIGGLISCVILWLGGSSRQSFKFGMFIIFGGRAIEACLMYSYKQAPRGSSTSNGLMDALLGSSSQGNNVQQNSEGAQDGDSEAADAITKDVGQHVADIESQDVPKQASIIVQGYSNGEGKTHERKTDEATSTTKGVPGTLKPEKRQPLCEEDVKDNVEKKPTKDDSTDNVTAET